MKDLLKFPLNIQLFADPSGNDGGEGSSQQQETNTDPKESAEYRALKEQFDKASSELAEYKKKSKQNLSETEKLKLDLEESNKQRQELQNQILQSKMSTEFIAAGFDETETNKLLESFKKNDSLEFVKTITSVVKEKIAKVRTEEQSKFQKGTYIPSSGNGSGSTGSEFLDNLFKANPNKKQSPLDYGKK